MMRQYHAQPKMGGANLLRVGVIALAQSMPYRCFQAADASSVGSCRASSTASVTPVAATRRPVSGKTGWSAAAPTGS